MGMADLITALKGAGWAERLRCDAPMAPHTSYCIGGPADLLLEAVTVDEIIDAGKHVVACGAEVVIISHDVTGDIAITRDAVWEIHAEVSTSRFKNLVGADDVFLGGILYKLAQESPLEEALRFGLAAGLASAESEEKICRNLAVIEDGMQNVTVTSL